MKYSKFTMEKTKFKVGAKITYDGLSGKITSFWKNTGTYSNVFEGEFKVNGELNIVLFDFDGAVKPFNKESNHPKVHLE